MSLDQSHEIQKSAVTLPHDSSALQAALGRITDRIAEGLKHGYFELTIHGSIEKRDHRSLVLIMGKSEKFIIRADEVYSS